MSKDWKIYAQHILDAIERIWDYQIRLEEGRAEEDIATDAILRNLETMSEAVADKLPDTVKSNHPQIEWNAIARFRNRLAHAYLNIDRSIIEQTVKEDLKPLYDAISSEIR